MTAFVKIEGGIVVQKQPYAESGFIEAPDDVVCGFEFDGEKFMPPPPIVPSLEDAIATKLAKLDDYRWQKEIGGAEFRGSIIRTDANSQQKITAVYAMARLDPSYEVPVWEVVPGVFIPLDNSTIIAMGDAVRDHIQGTFNRKAELHLAIASLETIEAVQSFDIAAEW